MTSIFRRSLSKAPPKQRVEDGFTLIELLIALVIFVMVIGTIYGLLEIGRVSRDRSSRRSDVLKNARVAIQLIGRDALNAGLSYNKNGARVPDNFLTTFGLPADADTNRDLLSSIVVGNNLFTNNLALNPATRTDTVAFCYRDMEFNTPTPPYAPGIIPTGEVTYLNTALPMGGNPAAVELVAQTPAGWTANTGAKNAKIWDLYLIENDISQAVIMATAVSGTNLIDAAPGDPLGMNQPINGSGSNGSLLRQCASTSDTDCMSYVANLTRFFLVSYKVRPDGTLVRTIYGNNRNGLATEQVQEQPLAYNIEDLQLKYVLDDGTVVDDPVATTGSQQAVNRIRQIMVTIKVQSTEIDQQTRLPDTITLNATFSTRNMEYDAG